MLIAERLLEYATPDGAKVHVPVKLYAPEGSGKHWGCRFTIDWPTGIQVGAGYGVDRMQAIILTLQMIGAHLYFSDYHKTGRLYFEKQGSGYGFPVPKNARDMLVGDDRTFEG
jgi:hypothetical protein